MYAHKQPDELQAFTGLHDSDLSRTAPCMNIKCGDPNGSLLGRAGTGARRQGVGLPLVALQVTRYMTREKASRNEA